MMNAITGRSSITSTLTGRGFPAFAGLESLLFNLVSNLCDVDRMKDAPRTYPHKGKGTGRTHGNAPNLTGNSTPCARSRLPEPPSQQHACSPGHVRARGQETRRL